MVFFAMSSATMDLYLYDRYMTDFFMCYAKGRGYPSRFWILGEGPPLQVTYSYFDGISL